MAITVVGTGGATSDTTTDPSASLPGGIQEGDVVYCVIGSGAFSDVDVQVVTSGYTQLSEAYANDSFDANGAVFRKVMGASPDTTVVAEASTAGGNATTISFVVLRGVDTTTPEDATTTQATGTNSSIPNAPSITTNTDDAMVVAFGVSTGSSGAYTAPSGYANLEVNNQFDFSSSQTSVLATKTITTSGAEDPAAFVVSDAGTTESWVAFTVAVKPFVESAITFVGSDSGQQGANTTGVTLTLPSHQSDDFGIIYGRADEAGTVPVLSIGTAAGWTLLRNENPTSGRDRVEYWWYKKFTSASETNPVVNISIAEEHSASVHVFRGVDTTTPLDVTEVFNSGQNDTTPVNSAITPVTANGALVLFHGSTHNDISAAGLPTTPSGLTLGETVLGGTNDHRGQITAYKLDYGPAATITPTAWTHTSSPTTTAEWSVLTVALRPAPSGPTITDVETDEEFDDEDTGVTITGAGFETTKGAGKVELGDSATYGSANLITQTTTSWADTSIDFTPDLGSQSPGSKWIYVTNDSGGRSDAFEVTVHRAQAFRMSASANIAASGANTTAQLTAPSGKTTGDFDAGRIQDDENPADSVNITADDYTEMEWAIEAKAAARDVQYDFRVTNNGVALDTYTVTPKLTIASGTNVNVGLPSETDSSFALALQKLQAIGLAAESDASLAIAALRSLATGQVTETDVALALDIARSLDIGLAEETSTGFAFGRLKLKSVGLANTADAAFALGASVALEIGITTETELALAIGHSRQAEIGLPVNDQAALVFGRSKLQVIGVAAEADGAFAVTAVIGLALALAEDASGAHAFTVFKRRNLGLSSSAESAQGVTVSSATAANFDDTILRRRRRRLH